MSDKIEFPWESEIPLTCRKCDRAKHAYAAAYMVREQQRRIEELENRLAKQDHLIRETYERASRATKASIDELVKVGRRRV